MTDYYAVEAHGPERDKLAVALGAAVTLAQKYQCPITILMPTIKSSTGTILSDALGGAFVRRLAKGEQLTLNTHPVVMRSMQTVNPYHEKGVVLGLWGADKMLAILDNCSQANAVIALSWVPEDFVTWLAVRKPHVLGKTSIKAPDAEEARSELLERSIKSLTGAVNVSTGLEHPSDDAKAKELFKALRADGEELTLAAVEKLAVANGWPASHARTLAKLAEHIGGGGRVVIKGAPGWGKPTVVRLKAEIAGGKSWTTCNRGSAIG